jgi:hypothetical protein
MPFASYASAGEVARHYDINYRREEIVSPIPTTLSDHFRSELDFALAEVPFDVSESAACENLIDPLLREVWRPHSSALTIWSHQPITYDEDLCGVPDFTVARRSHLCAWVPDTPYLTIVKARKDDFPRGWGQCLAAMLAIQKMNQIPHQSIYGITTNGLAWQFGDLTDSLFTQDPRAYSLQNVDELAAAINFALVQCRDQASKLARPA